MEIVNQFDGGMNQDLGNAIPHDKIYKEARNLRVVTDEGGSSGALINIKGNKLSFSITNTSDLYYLTYLNVTPNVPYSIQITINGQSGTVSGTFSTRLLIHREIAKFINDNSATTFSSIMPKASYTSERIAVHSTIENVTNFTLTTNSPHVFVTLGIPAITGPFIILKDTTIREEVVIFTAPVINPNKLGQIWVLEFDGISRDNVGKRLVYNGPIDFSPDKVMELEGRYETESIKKVYWLTRGKPFRFCNIENQDLMARNVDVFDVFAGTEFGGVQADNIALGGALPVGTIQYAYKYLSEDGSETLYSPLSPMYHLTVSNENVGNSGDYRGAVEYSSLSPSQIRNNSGKQVTVVINNLDNKYSKVQLVSLFRGSKTDIPVVTIVSTADIIGKSSVLITHTSLESNESIQISYEDFALNSIPFTEGKTLGTKDNILFISNTKGSSFDIDFDARAFRYKRGTGTTYVTSIEPGDTQDAINPYNNNIGYASNLNDAFKYAKNSNRIGGTGVNVSYTFELTPVYLDLDDSPSKLRIFNNGAPVSYYQGNQGAIVNKSFANFASPYLSGGIRGYKRGEIYRFGIIFYSKKGEASFVKWIGDIRMPDMSDVDSVSTYTQAGTPEYRFPVAVGKSDESFQNIRGFSLAPKFSINIPPDIAAQISGYQIVRVERTKEDMTIIGQGPTNKMHRPSIAWPYVQRRYMDNVDYYNDTISTIGTKGDRTLLELCFPEIVFQNDFQKKNGDYLQIVGHYDSLSFGNGAQSGGGPVANFFFFRKFGVTQPVNSSLILNNTIFKQEIFDITKFGPSNNYETLGAVDGLPVGHFTFQDPLNNGVASGFKARHGTGLAIKITAPFVGTTASQLLSPSAGPLMVEYRRVLANQYGGANREARSLNRYIPCTRITSVDAPGLYTESVYGGDIFINMFEYNRILMDPNEDEIDSPGEVLMTPVESTINLNLRTNRTATNGNTYQWTNPEYLYLQESSNIGGNLYEYNFAFSSEDNSVTHSPKPTTLVVRDEFDTRTWFSGLKINGESADSWTSFKISDYWDVEGTYGPINKILVFQDRIMFWQDRAFGSLAINPRALITDADGAQLQLGTGPIIQRHDYASTKIGCKHQFSITATDSGVYWFDPFIKALCQYGREGTQLLSENKGMHGFLQVNVVGQLLHNDLALGDTPLEGNSVISTYDYVFNEVLFTFLNRSHIASPTFTIAYSEITGAFMGFYDFTPRLYINTKDKLISTDPDNPGHAYLHNEGEFGKFYNVVHPSLIKLLINPYPGQTKVFDNIQFHTEATNNLDEDQYLETYNTLQCGTSFQTSGPPIILDPTIPENLRRVERSWQLAIPRNAGPDEDRLRDKYMTVTLTLSNQKNLKVILNYLKTIYRISPR